MGGDIGLNVGRSYHEAYNDRVYASPLVMMMNEAKNLGEKTGKGGQPCWPLLAACFRARLTSEVNCGLGLKYSKR